MSFLKTMGNAASSAASGLGFGKKNQEDKEQMSAAPSMVQPTNAPVAGPGPSGPSGPPVVGTGHSGGQVLSVGGRRRRRTMRRGRKGKKAKRTMRRGRKGKKSAKRGKKSAKHGKKHMRRGSGWYKRSWTAGTRAASTLGRRRSFSAGSARPDRARFTQNKRPIFAA